MIRFLALAFSFAFEFGCIAASAQAGASRIALLPEVAVSGDEILLSHLLGGPLPSVIQQRASSISFGKAPHFGSARLVKGSFVRATLSEAGLNPAGFNVPDSIFVHRAGRSLSLVDVAPALENFFREHVSPSPVALDVTQLVLPSNLSVPEGDLALFVRSAQFDPLRKLARFSLASRAFPSLTAFNVELAGVPSAIFAKTTSARQVRDASAPVLVNAGATARLVVSAPDSRYTLAVVATKQGRLGDIIRVRLPKTIKFLNARVVAKNSLEATF